MDSEIAHDIALGQQKYWENLALVYQAALSELGQNPDTPPSAIVSAAKEVFDRAYGKVAEKVELRGDVRLNLNLGIPLLPKNEVNLLEENGDS